MNEKPFRHECKYVCSAAQIALLESRLTGLLAQDVNAGDHGRYSIRSLYFDDAVGTCYKEIEAGTDPREIENRPGGRFSIILQWEYAYMENDILLNCQGIVIAGTACYNIP